MPLAHWQSNRIHSMSVKHGNISLRVHDDASVRRRSLTCYCLRCLHLCSPRLLLSSHDRLTPRVIELFAFRDILPCHAISLASATIAINGRSPDHARIRLFRKLEVFMISSSSVGILGLSACLEREIYSVTHSGIATLTHRSLITPCSALPCCGSE